MKNLYNSKKDIIHDLCIGCTKYKYMHDCQYRTEADEDPDYYIGGIGKFYHIGGIGKFYYCSKHNIVYNEEICEEIYGE